MWNVTHYPSLLVRFRGRVNFWSFSLGHRRTRGPVNLDEKKESSLVPVLLDFRSRSSPFRIPGHGHGWDIKDSFDSRPLGEDRIVLLDDTCRTSTSPVKDSTGGLEPFRLESPPELQSNPVGILRPTNTEDDLNRYGPDTVCETSGVTVPCPLLNPLCGDVKCAPEKSRTYEGPSGSRRQDT